MILAIYGIGDLHLDSTGEKPMGIFGENWINHGERIFNNWKKVIKDEDLVLIPGDISWALKLQDAYIDLEKIDKLPGTKVISKGNHDYWWDTKSKLDSLSLGTIHFIHNDCYIYENIAITGTRGWAPKDSEEFNTHDEKVFNREVNRLKLSILSVDSKVDKIIAMIHYPPFNASDRSPNEFAKIMKDHGVDICVYGHLHAEGHRFATEGNIEGIEYHCISCDFIDFELKKIL